MNSVTTRAILYAAISALAAGGSWLADAPDAPTWKQWTTLAVGCIVASLTSLRAYLDGSAERARQAVDVQHATADAAKGALLPLLLAGGLALGAAGCAHTPEAEAYLTLHHTKTVVLEAMDIYAVQLATGQVSPETEKAIDDAYLKWSAAFEAAVELARFDYASATPDTVKRLSLGLVALIDDL